jgi:hypothetical protein
VPEVAADARAAPLSRGVYALARTKRRRFLWCAWWTGEPTAKPFRPPDAWGGGAHTEEEAKALAERAAGRPLELVDGHWAGAWKRVVAGRAPFVAQAPASASTERVRPVDPYTLLGVGATATLIELKAAFRKKALEHHPDRGGDTDAFIALKRAYDAITRKRARARGRAR